MKKFMIILLVFVILLTALVIWQKNNIEALYLYLTNDKEEVEQIVEKNRKELEEKIKEYGEEAPRNFTPEEEAMIASGELSIEEATELILSEQEEETGNEAEEPLKEESVEEKPDKAKDDKGNKPVKDGNESEKDTSKKVESNKSGVSEGEIIRRYTAKFYSLKAYYMGQLSGIEAKAKSEYAALTKEQKKSLSKTAFAGKYISYATALQSECDGQVESLLSQMKAELDAVGGDSSIISSIRQTYNGEKAAKKAYYLSLIG